MPFFSLSANNPLSVEEYLAKHGIHFVIEPHLEGTYLDGAAFLRPQGNPTAALTLRHDRVDNFWFTLIHELAHIKLHLKTSEIAFFDETDGCSCEAEKIEEREAHQFAKSYTQNRKIASSIDVLFRMKTNNNTGEKKISWFL